MATKTLIYLTDNTLDEAIALPVRRRLEQCGLPVVSVSQKPMDLGRNICVGEIGRSWLSLYRQILAGIAATDTPYIGIAEHDCLYGEEHLHWIPPTDRTFYYNHNCWLVQWGGNRPEFNGMYSYWPRRFALSQLVCHKDLLRESTEEVMRLLDMGLTIKRGMKWYGEPGLVADTYKAFIEAESGRPTQLQRYLKEYVLKWDSAAFHTEIPNLDIRHGSNFTGPKRGKKRCYDLPYWGQFKTLMEGVCV